MFRQGIRHQLFRSFGLLLSLSLLLAAWSVFAVYKINQYHQLNLNAARVGSLLEQARKNEKEFLNTEVKQEAFYREKHSPLADTVHVLVADTQQLLDGLRRSDLSEIPGISNQLDTVAHYKALYSRRFRRLQKALLHRGFISYGQVGKLRAAIHAVERMEHPYNQAAMLMLRRHEKDFLLRHQLKYVDRFDRQIEAFKTSMRDTALALQTPLEQQRKIMSWIDDYQFHFHRLVESEQAIGLSGKQGMLLRLNEAAERAEAATHHTLKLINEYTASESRTTMLMLLGVFVVQLILGLVMANRFSVRLTGRIQEISRQIGYLSRGQIGHELTVNGRDELSQTATAINRLSRGVRAYSDFAGAIGRGELDCSFQQLSEDDLLGSSLLRMQHNLKKMKAEEKNRNWVLSESAVIGSIIRRREENMYGSLLSHLSNSTGAVQLAIFTSDTFKDGQTVLTMEACYAWDRPKFKKKSLLPGEGLTGEAFAEKKARLLTEVPQNYLYIRSGLGQTPPVCLFIVPLLAEDQACGVLELAALHVFAPHEQELIEKTAEQLASAIITRRQHRQTHKTNERLQRTQDDMQQKEAAYLARIEELKRQLAPAASQEIPLKHEAPAKAP